MAKDAYFVEYFIAGDPLPTTRLVKFDKYATPGEVCETLLLGQDVMKVTITCLQDEVTK